MSSEGSSIQFTNDACLAASPKLNESLAIRNSLDFAEKTVENIPFLSPRTRLNRPANRFFDASRAPSGCGEHPTVNAKTPSDHKSGELPDEEKRDGSALARSNSSGSSAATNDVNPLTEDDKPILQTNLEELFRADVAAPATFPACSYLLRRYFRIDSGLFRERQQEVCLSILHGVSTLAVCPTGWGKSICYQFPMLVHRLLFQIRYRHWETCVLSHRADLEQRHGQNDCTHLTVEPPHSLHSKFCIVVSPLLSLMADQAKKIEATGALRAVVLSSQVTGAKEDQLWRQLSSPFSAIDIVFISPEKFVSSEPLRELLVSARHRLAMICVDEVHCVSRWAYDFRPSFMYVSRLLVDLWTYQEHTSQGRETRAAPSAALPCDSTTRINPVPYLCLTATATKSVMADLQAAFQIEKTVMATDYFRRNLHLQSVHLSQRVASMSGVSAHEAASIAPTQRVLQDALVEAVRELPKPMIVYVQSRADADELASVLASKGASHTQSKGGPHSSSTGVFCASHHHREEEPTHSGTSGSSKALIIRSYHAALPQSLRRLTQDQFLQDEINVLVATVAFGMGIDKANIRSVVHAYAPSSLENYVQEIGRAGRDGAPSFCRILYNPFDYYSLRCRLWTSLISAAEMKSVLRFIMRAPTTHVGEKVMLVSVDRIAEELLVSAETIETILFVLLTSEPQAFTALRGTRPLGYHIRKVQRESLSADMAVGSDGGGFTGNSRKRSRQTRQTNTSGVGQILAQLNAEDGVLELLSRQKLIANTVDAANALGMSLRDFQFRLDDLASSGSVSIGRYSTAYVIGLGDAFDQLASPAGQAELAERLLQFSRERISGQVKALSTMFEILAHPTHQQIYKALQECAEVAQDSWSPPPRSLSRVEAVSLASDFVEKNRLRLHSKEEALRALLGIMPKSLVKHGKYAGQLPLSMSWYVSSPYFGALREFDLEWVERILAAHHLDENAEHDRSAT